MANFAPLIRDGGRNGGRFGRTEIRRLCASAYNSRNDCAPDGVVRVVAQHGSPRAV